VSEPKKLTGEELEEAREYVSGICIGDCFDWVKLLLSHIDAQDAELAELRGRVQEAEAAVLEAHQTNGRYGIMCWTPRSLTGDWRQDGPSVERDACPICVRALGGEADGE